MGPLFAVLIEFREQSFNPDGAVRSSSQSSFLTQALKTSSIAGYPHTQAKKMLFRSGCSGARAVGVSVTRDNQTYILLAKVILSAGVFHSLQLLKVSDTAPLSEITPNPIIAPNSDFHPRHRPTNQSLR